MTYLAIHDLLSATLESLAPRVAGAARGFLGTQQFTSAEDLMKLQRWNFGENGGCETYLEITVIISALQKDRYPLVI